MSRIFVTSDLHLGHPKGFLYEPRGFSSIDEHDAAIIDEWNKTVDPLDDVYVLGDLWLGDNFHGSSCFEMLNGIKHVVWGNHDTDTRKEIVSKMDDVEVLGYASMLKYKHWHFYLSHYPTITSNYDDLDRPLKARVINLCGHTHTKDKFLDMHKGLIYHCEVDSHCNKPALLDDIIEDLKEYDKKVREGSL